MTGARTAGARPMSPALLEDWMRAYYYDARYDLGSSGVQPWRLREVRELAGVGTDELDEVLLCDATSEGDVRLRELIAQRWWNGVADQVMVTHGSSEAIFLSVLSLLRAGDRVVVVDPCYHALDAVVEWAGCDVVRWPLSAEDGFRPDLDRLATLVAPDTRMIIVNFPHNPTGAVLTEAEAAELRRIAGSAEAYLLSDMVFGDLHYGGGRHPDPAAGYERGISIGTTSKAYGLPGLRIGWCLAAPEILRSYLPLRDRTTLILSPLIELLAIRVIAAADRLLAPRLAQARHNLGLLRDWAADNAGQLGFVEPGGGVTTFPALRAGIDTERLCRVIGEADGVLLVPGSCFGAPDRVRLGFGGATTEFAAGLDRLGKRLADD